MQNIKDCHWHWQPVAVELLSQERFTVITRRMKAKLPSAAIDSTLRQNQVSNNNNNNNNNNSTWQAALKIKWELRI